MRQRVKHSRLTKYSHITTERQSYKSHESYKTDRTAEEANHNLHLTGSQRVSVDGNRAVVDTVEADRDEERQVVRVGIRGVGSAQDTEGGAVGATVEALRGGQGGRGNQLNLTEVTLVARGGADGGQDGLAHVTQDQAGGSASGINRLLDGQDERGRGQLDVARRIISSGVAGIRNKLIHHSGWVSGNGGGAVAGGLGGNLANEASDG